MPELVVHLPRLHDGQQQLLRERRRFNVVGCGRRWGKSTKGEHILATEALAGYPVAYFEPTNKMLMEAWRSLTRTLAPVTAHVSMQEHRIELITGGSVTMWSLDNPDSSRGRKYHTVVIDEAAMVRKLQDAWDGAIRPTLTDMHGTAWFLSTPRGLNYFHALFRRGASGDPEYADWMSWQMPTVANPYIDPAEVEAVRKDTAEQWFRQEYLAEFLDMQGSVFRNIQQRATVDAQSGPEDGHTYVFGVDWGKLNDWTVIMVLDTTAKEVVSMARFNQIDYQLQLGRLTEMYERWRPASMIIEANAMGEPLIDQLRGQDLPVKPFHTSNASKAVAIDALALAFERGDIAVLNDPALVGELVAYEAVRLPSGLLRYSAPEGLHDDCVMALALAWSGVDAFDPVAWAALFRSDAN